MEVSSLYGLYETQYASEIDTRSKRKTTSSDSKPKGDTVSFSDEARALAAEMAARKVNGDSDSSAFEKNPNKDGTDEQGNALAQNAQGASGAAGGGQNPDSAASQIQKIEERIKQLSQQVVTIMSGPGMPEGKMNQAQPIQQQISSLQQQLNALKAEVETQAKQSAA